MRLLALLLAGSLLVSACSSQAGDERASPTVPAIDDQGAASAGRSGNPAPDQSGDNPMRQPPAAFLVREAGERFEGVTGSYFWTSGCLTTHADALDPITSAEPPSLQSGEAIRIEFTGLAADNVLLGWSAATAPPDANDFGLLMWAEAETWGPNLVAGGAVAPMQPGL